MGRPASISEADIIRAVEELQESRKPVNPYQIRQILGKGSTAKIAHYLHGLDIDSTYEDSEFQAAIDLNAERSEYLAKLVRPLIFQLEEEQQSAINEAKAKFETQRQELDELARGLEEKLSGKQSEVELLETRLANVERQRDSLEDDNQQLKIAAAANHEKQKALQEKIHSQSEEITERKKQLEQASSEKAALEHRHSEQQSRLQREFDELKEESSSYRNMAEDRFSEHRAEISRLQEQVDKQRENASLEAAERQRVEQELSDARASSKNLQESLSTQKSIVEDLERRLQDSESETKRVMESHSELKSSFDEAQRSTQALENANQSLVAEVEFLKDILRKFQSIRDEMNWEESDTKKNNNKSDESK